MQLQRYNLFFIYANLFLKKYFFLFLLPFDCYQFVVLRGDSSNLGENHVHLLNIQRTNQAGALLQACFDAAVAIKSESLQQDSANLTPSPMLHIR